MKIGQLYGLESFQQLATTGTPQAFKDAFAGSVLNRNLTAVDPQIFEKKYPELSFVNSGIDADNSGGYARVIQSMRTQGLGGFTTSGDSTSNDGKISMAGETSLLQVIERKASSLWTDSEVKEAALQNINLVSQYVSAHNKIYLREVDQIGYLGLPTGGIPTGLLNHAGFPSSVSTGAIGVLTPQQMYDDIANLVIAQHNAVNNTTEYMADKVDMPSYVLNKLAVTILNTANGASSVLQALKANFPNVSFRSTFRADNAGGVGVSHTVAYSTSSEAMKMRIPVPLTVGEIIRQGSFDFKIDSKYRVAGLDVLDDTAGYILTGL